jgi:hypothetical protein
MSTHSHARAVSYFIESLLRYHDRRQFKASVVCCVVYALYTVYVPPDDVTLVTSTQVICYSNVGKPDSRTLLMQPLSEVCVVSVRALCVRTHANARLCVCCSMCTRVVCTHTLSHTRARRCGEAWPASTQ